MILISLCLISQSTYAQFTGTNPATLYGDAQLSGNLNAGILPALFGQTNPPARKLNLSKVVSGVPPLGAPLSSYTTGLKITHRYSLTGSSYNDYNWEVAANSNTMYFHFANTSNTIMALRSNGRVGIQSNNPDATFHVRNVNATDLDAHLEGFTLLDGNQASLLLGAETNAPYGEWGIEYNTGAGGLNFWKPSGATTGYAASNYHLFIKNDGKVSIGLDPTESSTFNGDYRLYVDRGILTEKLKVALKTTNDWADYVFDKDYELMPLDKVEAYVTEHHHLPGVPSAEEVKKNGIDVATMDAKLLEKIEELTLHMIELEKKYNALKESLESTKNK